MSDAELMAKYDLSPKGLERLFQKLVSAKILDESYVSQRIATAKPARATIPAPPPTLIPNPHRPNCNRRLI